MYVPKANAAAVNADTLKKNYDFGFNTSGTVASGYTAVTPSTLYKSTIGYGLASSSGITAGGITTSDALNGDYLQSSTPITFYQDVEPGDYQVTVTHKSSIVCESDPGKAGVSVDGFTKANQSSLAKSTFTVAVVDGKLNLNFTPAITTTTSTTTSPNGTTTTTSKDGAIKTTVVVLDGKATTTVTDNIVQVASMEITKLPARTASSVPSLYVIGDSTGKNIAPIVGWGQEIQSFLGTKFNVVNTAIAGRSSKKYYNEGRLDKVLTAINPGDYVMIQFGHNDQGVSTKDRWTPLELFEYLYKDYFIKGIKQRGGIPVILSTTTKYNYNATNNTFEKLGPVTYCDLAKKIAQDEGVKFIDVMNMSVNYYNSLPANTRQSTVYKYYTASLPSGGDTTHFIEPGAKKIAELISNNFLEQIKK